MERKRGFEVIRDYQGKVNLPKRATKGQSRL